MALDVTVAGASADSYCTVAEADAFVGWKAVSAWDNASTTTKEGALKAAVRLMDELPYLGAKSDTAQALRFPSGYLTDSNGNFYIPTRIKEAQALLALALMENPSLDDGERDVQSISVAGSFSVNYGKADARELMDVLPNSVLRRLDRYLWKSGPGPYREWDSARRGYA